MQISFHGMYWDDSKKRRFLPKQQKGFKHHNGHMHVDPNLIRVHIKHAVTPKEQQIVVKDTLDSEISATALVACLRPEQDNFLDGINCII